MFPGAEDNVVERGEKWVLNYIWKSPTPLKVLTFSWTLLQDHIPTWDNLALRRVLGGEDLRDCVLCGRRDESATRFSFIVILWLRCGSRCLIE